MSRQPRDDANYPIPVLCYSPGGGQAVSIDNVPYRSSELAPGTRVISLYSTVDCFFELGNSSVSANSTSSHFLPTGIYIESSLGSEVSAKDNYKYVSVISATGETGTLYISERV